MDLGRTVPSRGQNPSVSFSQPCLAPELSAFSGPGSPIFPKPEQSRLHSAFCPQHGWRMNGCFVPGYTKPFVRDSSGWGWGGNRGTHSPILPGRLTDSKCAQAAGQKQRSRWNLGPGGRSRGKEVVAPVGRPQRLHSQVSVSPAPAAPPCVPSTRSLSPPWSLE